MTERQQPRASEAVYIISVAARLAGVHPQTLRIYERKGLIEPYRTPGGTRRYSQEDIDRLGSIQDLTAAGVSLEGVRRILDLESDNQRLRDQVARLRRLLAEAEERIAGRRAGETVVRTVGVVRRRHLPDILRPGIERLLEG